jgi:NTP pyrophosphatase (non-canonical NTP hydrolase)
MKDPKEFSESNNAFDQYEKAVMSLAFYPKRGSGDLSYPMLGLNGEAGEAAEHWKKALRDDGGRLDLGRKLNIMKELGDQLWYITACAEEMGFTLREVAEMNQEKLFDRARRGELSGSGDAR